MGAPSDISEYCRTSETGLELLSLYCTSSTPDRPFHLLSILSCSSLNKPLFASILPPQLSSLPIALHSFSFHLSLPFHLLSHLLPSLSRPPSSVPAGYSPDLDFHFPPSILVLSTLPQYSLQPILLFALKLSSNFSPSLPTLDFYSVLPWGFREGLKWAV